MKHQALRLPKALLPESGLAAIGTQAMIVGINLLAGVILARGLSTEDRGLVALMNLATTVVGLVGALGIPELSLRLQSRVALSRATRLLLGSFSVLSALVAAFGFMFIYKMSSGVMALFAAVIVMSSQNSYALAQMFRATSLKALSLTQGAYAGSICTLLALGYSTSHLDVPAVLVVWLVSEGLVAGICRTLTRQSRRTTSTLPYIIGPREALKSGVPHCLSQVGSSLSDRGLVVIVSAFGGLPAAAYTTVAQSCASSVLVPVQALTPALLRESARPGPRRYAQLCLGGIVTLAAIGFVAIPELMIPLYGPNYADLALVGPLLACVGLVGGIGRLNHIYLRGIGWASYATASDVASLLLVLFLVASATVPVDVTGLIVLLLFYSVTSLVLTSIGALLGRRWSDVAARTRSAEHSPTAMREVS